MSVLKKIDINKLKDELKLFPQKIKEINEDEIKQKILLISRLINFMKIEMETVK